MITIPTVDESLIESTETVDVTLTGIAAGDPDMSLGGTTSAVINMLDNDSATWSITGDAAVGEGSAAAYAVTLSGSFQSGQSTSIDVAIADVTTSTIDYADFDAAVSAAVTAYSGPGSFAWDGTTLTFTADADNQSAGDLNITLGTVDDSIVEANEDYNVSLSNPVSLTGATVNLGASTVTTTINDNDVATISIAPTADGFESGSVAGQFTVTITTPSSTNTVIDYTLTGTATSGIDFAPVSGQVTILAGDTSATIDIATIDDAMTEPTETIIATLTGNCERGQRRFPWWNNGSVSQSLGQR